MEDVQGGRGEGQRKQHNTRSKYGIEVIQNELDYYDTRWVKETTH